MHRHYTDLQNLVANHHAVQCGNAERIDPRHENASTLTRIDVDAKFAVVQFDVDCSGLTNVRSVANNTKTLLYLSFLKIFAFQVDVYYFGYELPYFG
jgi:hypothetical protein